jgi:hypothetical protein
MTEEMLNKINITIKKIQNYDDFKNILKNYQSSESPMKFEAIDILKDAFPQYKDCSNSVLNAKALAKECEPDYQDIG